MRACPSCGGTARVAFLNRERVPVFQNAPEANEALARAAPAGALCLTFCRDCGFVANDAFDPGLMAYGGSYENDQTRSAVFEAHVGSLVAELSARGLAGKRILEVGCGSGYFLRRLCGEGRSTGLGYDTAYRGPLEDAAGSLRFVADYYRGEPLSPPPDLVVSRHVIEHVPAPREFLRLLRGACREGSQLFLETPSVGWILEHQVLQDFFYEHCSYFSPESLRVAVESEGFHVERIATLFGGQYLWLEATASARPAPAAADPVAVARLEQAARAYGAAVERRLEAVRRLLEALRARGPVALWGAGAKGVTLAHLADPERRLVDCLVDINPKKQGRFVPGTGHAIVGPEALRARRIRNVVVMNPNYTDEVAACARQIDPAIEIHLCDAA